MEKQLDKVASNTEILSQRLNEQQEQATKENEILNGMKDKDSRGELEIGQLRTQLHQQQTQMTQDSNRLTTVNANVGEVQSALRELKVTWQKKWTDVNKHTAEVKDTDARLEIQQLRTQLQRLEASMKTQMPHDQLHSMTLLYQWHITDIKTKDGGWNLPKESEVFALTGYDCGAKASIGRGEWMYLRLINSKKIKTPIGTRSMPKLTVVIESQSQTTQDKQLNSTHQHSTHGIRTRFIPFDESLDYGEHIHVCDISPFLRPPYVVSNEMKLSVYIEPPSMARSFFSNNGILLWQLDNYKERLQMQVDGLIERHESPYFYTSPHGYRVLLRLWLSDEIVCGWLWFVKGEHDSSLTKLFPHRLTVTLFNHTDQSKNLVTSQQGNMAYYDTYFKFKTASASSLESGGYVADDSLLIKAVVASFVKGK